MIKWLFVAFFSGMLAGITVCWRLQGNKIEDLYAEIDYLKSKKEEK